MNVSGVKARRLEVYMDSSELIVCVQRAVGSSGNHLSFFFCFSIIERKLENSTIAMWDVGTAHKTLPTRRTRRLRPSQRLRLYFHKLIQSPPIKAQLMGT